MKRFLCGRRWWQRVLILAALAAVVTVAGLTIVIERYGSVDRARPAGVIIVLGGGRATEHRTLHAVDLYHAGYAPYLLCTGGVRINGGPFESEVCAAAALAHGVPANAIFTETVSTSTEENAIQARSIMHDHGWADAVIVSDDYHLWRANWIFSSSGIRVWPSPADGSISTLDESFAVLREIAALGWYAGKTVLGFLYTHF